MNFNRQPVKPGPNTEPTRIKPGRKGAERAKRRRDQAERFTFRAAFENERDGELERITEESPRGPFTTRPRNYDEAQDHFEEELTEREQRRDRQSNEPIPRRYETWKNNVHTMDWPRVDTIPEDELNRRGDRIIESGKDAGFVEQRREVYLPVGKRGRASDRTKIVTTEKDPVSMSYTMFAEGTTEAHETGHLIDSAASPDGERFLSEELLDSGELREQAEQLSRRVRGDFDLWKDRELAREKMPDVFTSMLLEPQAAEREAPELVGAVEDRVQEETGVRIESMIGWPENPL